MAKKSIISKIRGLFKKKPKAPEIPNYTLHGGGGHRGVAGRRYNEQGMPEDLSPENVAKWENLSKDTGEGFLHDQGIVFVHSSNVNAVQYFKDAQQMMVEFKGGAAYLYSNIPFDYAVSFINAESKGSWVWDFLRVRGTSKGHKKPYVRIK